MLHTLKPDHGSRRKAKRVARGAAHGGGTTAGRGTKGQQSRTGKGRRHGFEGGQTPLLRRQPKLGGFEPPRRTRYEVVTTSVLEARLPEGSYDLDGLRARRIIRRKGPVKLLAGKELSKKFVLTVHAASASARKMVEKAGGSVTVVPFGPKGK